MWGRGDDRLYTCTVVTAPAVGALTEVHPRMPLVLPRTGGPPGSTRPARTSRRSREATPPDYVERLEIRPVGTAVGNVANNGVQLTARQESVSAPADQPALF